MTNTPTFAGSCPLPLSNQDHVTLAHGGGGRMMHTLLERVVLSAFGNQPLASRHDGAVLETGKGRIAFTILPRPNASQGTLLTNQASIVFDTNPPVITNQPSGFSANALAASQTRRNCS